MLFLLNIGQIMSKFLKFCAGCGCLLFFWVAWVGLQVHSFSSVSSSQSADVAIVLGAAVWDGQPSPVFEERIKHGINLYQTGRVKRLIFTGGIGDADTQAESEVAKAYAIKSGVPSEHIFIETTSRITYENLLEACTIIGRERLQSALIVSDPLHMRRSVSIALQLGINAHPSPTPTSRYQSWRSKSRFLAYETFFYSGHLLNHTVFSPPTCPLITQR